MLFGEKAYQEKNQFIPANSVKLSEWMPKFTGYDIDTDRGIIIEFIWIWQHRNRSGKPSGHSPTVIDDVNSWNINEYSRLYRWSIPEISSALPEYHKHWPSKTAFPINIHHGLLSLVDPLCTLSTVKLLVCHKYQSSSERMKCTKSTFTWVHVCSSVLVRPSAIRGSTRDNSPWWISRMFGHSAKTRGTVWHTHSRPTNRHSHSRHNTQTNTNTHILFYSLNV